MAEQVTGLTGGQLAPDGVARAVRPRRGQPVLHRAAGHRRARLARRAGSGGLPARLAELLAARVSDGGPQRLGAAGGHVGGRAGR